MYTRLIAAALLLALIAHPSHSEEAQNPASPVAQAAKVLAQTGCLKPAPKKAKPKVKPKTWIVPPCAQPAPLPLDIAPPQILPYYTPAPEPLDLMPPPGAALVAPAPTYSPDVPFYMPGAPPAFGGVDMGAVSVSVVQAAAVVAKPVPIVVNVAAPKVTVNEAAPVITITNSVTATASASASAIAISSSTSNASAIATAVPMKTPEIDASSGIAMLTMLCGFLAVARGGRRV